MSKQKNCTLLLLLLLAVGAVYAQDCTIADIDKIDCGYVGINQQLCESKGCCWQPVPNQQAASTGKFMPKKTEEADANVEGVGLNVPWCFFKNGQSPCQDISFTGAPGPGFDDSFYQKMYALFLQNLDIQNKGGVCASPDTNTPGGSYYYDWMRDGALSWRTFIEINDFQLSAVQSRLQDYVQWVLHVQSEPDPNGIDVRTEPKFNLPDGSVYTRGWCRPQTDGPGLRSATLQMFANLLLDAGQEAYVRKYLWTSDGSYNGGAIRFDLDWVVNNWIQNGCDLWEEVRSDNFFWNRMAFRYSLSMAEKFATRMGDSTSSQKYASVRQ
jgi:glucoamylase